MDTLIKTLRRIGAYLITNTSGHLVTLGIIPLALWALSTTGRTSSLLEGASLSAALIILSPITAAGLWAARRLHPSPAPITNHGWYFAYTTALVILVPIVLQVALNTTTLTTASPAHHQFERTPRPQPSARTPGRLIISASAGAGETLDRQRLYETQPALPRKI